MVGMLFLAVAMMGQDQDLPVVEPKAGLVITKSVRLKPGEYVIPNTDEDGRGGAITIKGTAVKVVAEGVILRGSDASIEPDERAGTGVYVTGGAVTITGLKVHGYKNGLIGRDAHGLKIFNSDFSYNYKPRLKSTLEKEDLSDWMSYHDNEKDEWLRFGAGVYLANCDRFEMKEVDIVGGQNGVMLTQCEYGKIWNSNFSFLSAIGLGMYRSSQNTFMHNNIDWCVRGYSHGVYNRGQDSTGILIYEQSRRNTFAFNSVTHGGDGFFLWAGNATMDSGQGGCNDNIVYGNDFSHAPTNGIEATFSRNVFANNKVLECWHGVWGGYSYESKFYGNVFGFNAEAFAIEHGQNNEIVGNVFRRDTTGLKIWANASENPDWGYPKHRDTSSRDLLVKHNIFWETTGTVFDFGRTTGVLVEGNFIKRIGDVAKASRVSGVQFNGNEMWLTEAVQGRFEGVGWKGDGNTFKVNEGEAAKGALMQPSGNVVLDWGVSNAEYVARFDVPWSGMEQVKGSSKTPLQMSPEELRQNAALPFSVEALEGGKNPFLEKGTLRGRRFILVDEWGPYDFQSPKLWPRSVDGATRRFEVLGPVGAWKVGKVSPNVTLSASSGTVPGYVDVTVTGEAGNYEIGLEYVGEETVDYRGVVSKKGATVGFGWSEFRVPIDWHVRFWNYSADTQDPRTQAAAFAGALSGTPAAEMKVSELVGSWGGSPAEGVNADYFATVADGVLEIAPGEYELEITSDDGVRVSVDGKVVLEDWTYHAPKTDTVKLKLGGKHNIKVEHFELNGYSALQVRLKPARK